MTFDDVPHFRDGIMRVRQGWIVKGSTGRRVRCGVCGGFIDPLPRQSAPVAGNRYTQQPVVVAAGTKWKLLHINCTPAEEFEELSDYTTSESEEAS